jgi:uncharacterized protein (DUF433 family)
LAIGDEFDSEDVLSGFRLGLSKLFERGTTERSLMPENVNYKHLRPKRGSAYEQLAVDGRIRTEILFRETIGPEPATAEEVAKNYSLPLEAVLEAIQYCERNRELLDAERAREQAAIETRGLNRWPHAPTTVAVVESSR